jgi:hypothetical protein
MRLLDRPILGPLETRVTRLVEENFLEGLIEVQGFGNFGCFLGQSLPPMNIGSLPVSNHVMRPKVDIPFTQAGKEIIAKQV